MSEVVYLALPQIEVEELDFDEEITDEDYPELPPVEVFAMALAGSLHRQRNKKFRTQTNELPF